MERADPRILAHLISNVVRSHIDRQSDAEAYLKEMYSPWRRLFTGPHASRLFMPPCLAIVWYLHNAASPVTRFDLEEMMARGNTAGDQDCPFFQEGKKTLNSFLKTLKRKGILEVTHQQDQGRLASQFNLTDMGRLFAKTTAAIEVAYGHLLGEGE